MSNSQSEFKIKASPAQIKQAIENKYLSTEANIHIEGDTIFGTIYTKDKRMLESIHAHRELETVAQRAADYPGYPATRFVYFKNQIQHKATLVHRLVFPKFNRFSRMYGTFVDVGMDQHNLQITVTSWEFREHGNSRDRAREIVEGLKDEILNISGCEWLTIHTCDDRQTFPVNYGVDDDDDDDPNCPNWPSKTGNPSGGGRDNNPPR